ncbi:L-rhamnose-binding lectin SML-like [Nothobranchius furzeri]|nr:L-rhamnose-binding lectin SML-like [Nothobranchius furzeri]XP_054602270.1 L-rhamnose-binding lectin SML-like [Nothobranchius furzeri]
MASRLLFLLLLGNMFCEAFAARHLIICEQSTVELKCAFGMTIYVDSAEYGRHDTVTCSFGHPPYQLQNTFCSSFTTIVAENCNGGNSCSITASNDVYGNPCPGTVKYLIVIYDCY